MSGIAYSLQILVDSAGVISSSFGAQEIDTTFGGSAIPQGATVELVQYD